MLSESLRLWTFNICSYRKGTNPSCLGKKVHSGFFTESLSNSHLDFFSGEFIDLSSSSKSPMTSSKLKALAALKGKPIQKTNPNQGVKRKRTPDEVEKFKVSR